MNNEGWTSDDVGPKQCAEIESDKSFSMQCNLIANVCRTIDFMSVEQITQLELEAGISKLQNEKQKNVNDEMIRETQLQEMDNEFRNVKAQVH
ncbi:hypothetical protein Tco_0806723 [Tanacetum coccineum]